MSDCAAGHETSCWHVLLNSIVRQEHGRHWKTIKGMHDQRTTQKSKRQHQHALYTGQGKTDLQKLCQLAEDVQIQLQPVARRHCLLGQPATQATLVPCHDQVNALRADAVVMQLADTRNVCQTLHDADLCESYDLQRHSKVSAACRVRQYSCPGWRCTRYGMCGFPRP